MDHGHAVSMPSLVHLQMINETGGRADYDGFRYKLLSRNATGTRSHRQRLKANEESTADMKRRRKKEEKVLVVVVVVVVVEFELIVVVAVVVIEVEAKAVV